MPRPSRTQGYALNDVASAARVRLNLILAAVGAGGAVASWLMMSDAAGSGRAAARLGMSRVANNWEHILSILAVPALMFFLILLAWSVVELVRAYRLANDPNRYRNARQQRGRGI